MVADCNRGTHRASGNGRKSQRREKKPKMFKLLTLKKCSGHQLYQKVKRLFGKCSGLGLQRWKGGGESWFHYDLGQLTFPQ